MPALQGEGARMRHVIVEKGQLAVRSRRICLSVTWFGGITVLSADLGEFAYTRAITRS
jgi:hypothetical protein